MFSKRVTIIVPVLSWALLAGCSDDATSSADCAGTSCGGEPGASADGPHGGQGAGPDGGSADGATSGPLGDGGKPTGGHGPICTGGGTGAGTHTVTLDGGTCFQVIDGFGVAAAFGTAEEIMGLPVAVRQNAVDLLFKRDTGAGLSMLRILAPSDAAHTIEPSSPGSPSATPAYVWDGSSWGQVWLAKQAQTYGVSQFYLDAWSAPAFMKTNGSETNGGALCGVPGTSCGDWRAAYASYLVKYLEDYASEGVNITHVGPYNEPNLSTSYSSMTLSAAQAADFTKVLASAITASGYSTRIVGCEPSMWSLVPSYVNGINADPAASAAVSVFSGHAYGTDGLTTAIAGAGSKHVWMTEWFDQVNRTWDASWDSGNASSGYHEAYALHVALTQARLSAFVQWGSLRVNPDSNAPLMRVVSGSLDVAKRLWAMAGYARFVRPGATRIGATSTDSNLLVSAYQNDDGTVVGVVLNQSHAAVTASFGLANVGDAAKGTAIPYLSDATHDMTALAAVPVAADGSLSVSIPPRALLTLQIAPPTTP